MSKFITKLQNGSNCRKSHQVIAIIFWDLVSKYCKLYHSKKHSNYIQTGTHIDPCSTQKLFKIQGYDHEDDGREKNVIVLLYESCS